VSRRALEGVIGRAILDAEFRFALFADPDGALAEHELLDSEKSGIRTFDAESIEACASILRHTTVVETLALTSS
jgi:hypothetical protein